MLFECKYFKMNNCLARTSAPALSLWFPLCLPILLLFLFSHELIAACLVTLWLWQIGPVAEAPWVNRVNLVSSRPTTWNHNRRSLGRQVDIPHCPDSFATCVRVYTAKSLHKSTLISATSLKNASICLSFAASCSGGGGPASRSAAEYSLEGVSFLCKRYDSVQLVGADQHTSYRCAASLSRY